MAGATVFFTAAGLFGEMVFFAGAGFFAAPVFFAGGTGFFTLAVFFGGRAFFTITDFLAVSCFFVAGAGFFVARTGFFTGAVFFAGMLAFLEDGLAEAEGLLVLVLVVFLLDAALLATVFFFAISSSFNLLTHLPETRQNSQRFLKKRVCLTNRCRAVNAYIFARGDYFHGRGNAVRLLQAFCKLLAEL